jgi:hypothetical protein
MRIVIQYKCATQVKPNTCLIAGPIKMYVNNGLAKQITGIKCRETIFCFGIICVIDKYLRPVNKI